MPPVAAAVVGLGGAVVGAVGGIGAGLTAAAIAEPLAAAGLGLGAYSSIKSSREMEKARKSAESQSAAQLRLADKSAGEYYKLQSEQMELQSQSAQITTLANLIERKRQPVGQQVITLPPAKEYSAFDQINRVIEKWFRG